MRRARGRRSVGGGVDIFWRRGGLGYLYEERARSRVVIVVVGMRVYVAFVDLAPLQLTQSGRLRLMIFTPSVVVDFTLKTSNLRSRWIKVNLLLLGLLEL